jgi:hypothetical protein
MYGNPGTAYTSSMSTIYAQSIKQGANNITTWNGVLSGLQDVSAGGTLLNWRGFSSAINKDNFDITTAYHYYASDASGTGTIATQVGLYFEKLDNATSNYGIYLLGVGDGENDYAIYIDDGKTFFKHTYGGTSGRAACYLEYVLAGAGGAAGQQGILSRMRDEFTAAYTSTMTHLYTQSLKSNSNNISNWIGVRSRLAESGTASGTVSEWKGFFSEVVSNGFSVTNARHFYVGNATGTSGVSTQYGLYIEDLTKGTVNYGIYIGGANTAAIYVAADDAIFRGNVGIGDATAPSANLHIKSTGDASIWIEADSDDSGESDNPWIKITQDNGNADAIIGFCGATAKDPENVTYTGAANNALLIGRRDNLAAIQFGTNTTVRAQISSSGHFLPGSSNSYTLGAAGTSWQTIHAENPAAYRGVTAASYRVVIPAGAFSADHNTGNGASMRVDNTSSFANVYWELGEDDYITAALPVPHNGGNSTYTLTAVTLYVTSVASSGTLYVYVYRNNYNSSTRTLVGSGNWTTGDGLKTISLSHAVEEGDGYTILVYKDGTGSMLTYSASAVFSMANPAVAWNA